MMQRYLTFIFGTVRKFLSRQVLAKSLCLGGSHWELEKGWEGGGYQTRDRETLGVHCHDPQMMRI